MKPKVLFILHFPPPVHGAAMVGQFIKRSNIINENFDTAYINLSTSTTVNEVGKGGINKIISTCKLAAKVIRALSKVNYDLCYMTLTAKGFGYYKDFIIVVILKIFRKTIIYHFHNKGVSTRQQNTLDNLLYKFTFNATKSILLSSLLYTDISKYVDRKDIFVCGNGIPEIENKVLTEKEAVDSNDRCKLLFLSNMVVEKGVLVLLEACKLLKEKNLNFECHFVGDWASVTEEMFNELISENNLSKYIFAHGKKYNDEKLYFYNSADIFVFPTFYHNECFPLVLLEAMQFNLPIVSTNEGGIAEIISDGITGFIVPQNNSRELAEKLELLIENKELRLQMGKAGRLRFQNKYTLNHFENCLSDALKKALPS
ncbi:glycosyltransferase family 4 protein [Segetibacter koreensis]|uniref:glycosyltransferase family 4 protein n=1 Tax=Segetibacter koreensis TaxID=398037 RepID=UPI00035C48D6|nr:glycosyltransferase family 4 protein [Segetibacter koreensis]